MSIDDHECVFNECSYCGKTQDKEEWWASKQMNKEKINKIVQPIREVVNYRFEGKKLHKAIKETLKLAEEAGK
jgi:hypothetical protein